MQMGESPEHILNLHKH